MPKDSNQQRLSAATRNEIGMIATVFASFAGVYFVMPFLPLYVQELGHFDTPTTALWSGVILGATPLVSALAGPFWGAIADRYGRRIVLQRSLIGFALCLGAMGFATAPWHLLVIRIVEGLFGGFMASASALLSTTSPSDRITIGIGRIQASRVLGMATGPLPGGFLAELYGYRAACFVSLAIGIVAFLLTFLTSEPARPLTHGEENDPPIPLRRLLLSGAFFSALVAVLVTRLVDRTFDPVIPLILGQSDTGSLGAASATSIVVAAGLITSSVAAATTGHFVRESARSNYLLGSLLLGALAVAPIAFSDTWLWWQLLLFRALSGILIGASLTLSVSLVATETPLRRRGFALGVIGAGTSYGSSFGLLLSGVMGSTSLTRVFAVDSVLMLASALVYGVARGWFRRSTIRLQGNREQAESLAGNHEDRRNG